MNDDRRRTNDGAIEKNVSDNRNADYKPSVPANYNPPPPIKVPQPPTKQGK